MSYSIKGNTIALTRGDTFMGKISLVIDGEPYVPSDDDVIRFAVKNKDMTPGKKEYVDEEPLIEKTIPNGSLILKLDPSDTKELDFGDYVYDVQITLADGSVTTFITASTFRITPEVA